MIGDLMNFILHIDKYIYIIIQSYGAWVYLILFLIVFCETGFVVIPFLPGDSVIFASGAFASISSLNIKYIFLLFFTAAVLGDTVNYHIGHFIGPKIFNKEESKLFKKNHLARTHAFYEKHGAITIILARFMPIVRTFAPFVAGIGEMSYLRFLSYNLIGGILWVSMFAFSGYYFGNIPFVRNNFSTVVYSIILISLLPAMVELLKNSRIGSYLRKLYKRLEMFASKYESSHNDTIFSYFIGAALVLISGLTFLELVEDCLIYRNWSFDAIAIKYVYGIRGSTLDSIFKIITSTGNTVSIIVISLIILIVSIYKKKKNQGIFFASNILCVWIFNEILKVSFKRLRPSGKWLVNATGYSFPSGHAMLSMALSLLLIYYILSYVKNRRTAITIVIVIFAYSILVGLSRVYVGVHYLSDVLAGWMAGLLWVTLTIFAYKHLVSIRKLHDKKQNETILANLK